MFSHLSDNYKGIIFAIIGFGSFAIADACAKWLSASYTVGQVICLSSFFALAFMLLISRYLGGLKETLRTKKRKIHALRGLNHVCISFVVILAFSKLPFAQTYTLFFIAPFIATILSIPIFKEKVDWHGWLAIIIGFSGVLVILRPGFAEINPWLFLPLIAAFFIAGLFLLARGLGKEETLLSLCMYPISATFVASCIYGAPGFVWPETKDIAIFALQGVTLTIGMTGVANAFRTAKSSVVGPFHYTQIIWASLLGYIIFDETPDRWTVLGAAIIIGSGIYLIEREHNAKRGRV